eukprot:TRINITY_DN12164_c0_g1_i2.p1 TRINITY_DN12164_c0_g1~~TRINITY_DN12164_c0_g1_i2.p1  ORF type:complete len:545 (+),score=179.84 TRINITY_DN12164_c0_g1_i2:310-1944(+)
MTKLHEEIDLHEYKDAFVLVPRVTHATSTSFLSPTLVISRTSDEIYLDASVVEKRGPPKNSILTYGIFGFIQLQACNYLAIVTERMFLGYVKGEAVYRVAKMNLLPYHPNPSKVLSDKKKKYEKKFVSVVESLLNDRFFYFSYSYNLSVPLHLQRRRDPAIPKEALHVDFDKRFFWNRRITKPLRKLQLHPWVLPVMRGYVHVSMFIVEGLSFDFCLLSRRSKYRAGTRYLTRGVDERGHVANYVETEQILGFNGEWSSFIQTRGSIPLYWGQTSTSFKYRPSAHLTHSLGETGAAFQQHFERELDKHKKQLIVNLLDRKGDERKLSEAFESFVSNHANPSISYVAFDFHAFCKNDEFENVGLLVEKVADRLAGIGFYKEGRNGEAEQLQDGCIRTNCLDCLDRTNLVQSTFAMKSLMMQFHMFNIFEIDRFDVLERGFKEAWANNGDAISLQYAGTSALKGDFTRTGKRNATGKMRDGVNSLSRFVINNFWDGWRQVAIDLTLQTVQAEMIDMAMLEEEEKSSAKESDDADQPETFSLNISES